MRLIDADALLEAIGKNWYTSRMSIITEIITNAPTVQREEYGKHTGWVSVPSNEILAWFIYLPDGNHTVAMVDSELADNFKKRDDCIMEPLYAAPTDKEQLR